MKWMHQLSWVRFHDFMCCMTVLSIHYLLRMNFAMSFIHRSLHLVVNGNKTIHDSWVNYWTTCDSIVSHRRFNGYFKVEMKICFDNVSMILLKNCFPIKAHDFLTDFKLKCRVRKTSIGLRVNRQGNVGWYPKVARWINELIVYANENLDGGTISK